MNDIRKNTEEEKTLITARFKVPAIITVFMIISFVNAALFFILGIVIVASDESSIFLGSFMITMSMFLLVIGIIMAVGSNAIKHCKCEITNKRIKGVTTNFIGKKTYSYRLDEIDNVEVTTFVGVSALALNFTQGYGPQNQTVTYHRGITTVSASNTCRLSYIANAQELYEKASELITSLKNHEDVMVDIEMKKVEAANKQAEAIEKLATGSPNTTLTKPSSESYIEELKQLKELLDSGIITQEEFDSKKADVLANK